MSTTDLTIEGMTCAACVSRVEKRLGRIEGVTAAVNLATGRARVNHPASVSLEELLAAIERAGYTGRARAPRRPAGGQGAEEGPSSDRAARDRLVILALLAVPVIVLSMIPALQFRNWQQLCFTLAAPVATWGAWPFHARAAAGLRHATATMDTLVSLGVLASFGWSVYALYAGGAGMAGMHMSFAWTATPEDATAHLYLEAAVGVPLFVSLGRFLEARARRRTGSVLTGLTSLAARDFRLEDGRRAPIADLAVGGRFVVGPGERIAADGIVVEGSSAVDTHLLTGESAPAECGPGDRVAAGTTSLSGTLVVRATAVGAGTRLARITELVESAQTGKARAQRRADQIAGVFVPMVLAVSVTTFGFWWGAGADTGAALTAAIAVLVVACPCALGLATPLALVAATGAGARRGVLVGGPQVLERLGRIDTIVLDKTGTLTAGAMSVLAVSVVPGEDTGAVLRLAAAVESVSEHPIARAVRQAAIPYGVPSPAADAGTEPGRGVRGEVDGHVVTVGRCEDPETLPDVLCDAVGAADERGHTSVVVTADERPLAVLTVGDGLRAGADGLVRRLERMGLRTIMATGDRLAPARTVARHLGVADLRAGLDPIGKAGLVADLQAEGRTVAVAGDGINDTAALARADLGIAVADGTDAAIGAADVTLVHPDLGGIADAIALARRTARTIRVNLAWAFAYNLVTVPLAALGRLNPMLAAAAMSCSSLLVAVNSLRLLRGGRR
ncbi:heavy metal translocating P-type ATPase [Actinomadura nitritigenes]|uniref:heavy metal translocating P-type ATPase n=1 Tax=Actinomadura nitritigenes TaxID=134602 RepID=UPI003D8AE1A6